MVWGFSKIAVYIVKGKRQRAGAAEGARSLGREREAGLRPSDSSSMAPALHQPLSVAVVSSAHFFGFVTQRRAPYSDGVVAAGDVTTHPGRGEGGRGVPSSDPTSWGERAGVMNASPRSRTALPGGDSQL